MEVVRYIMMVVYAIVCVALTYLTFKQTKEEGSTVITGASGNNFYEKNKGNSREGKEKKATIALLIVFAVMTVALGIIYVA